MSMIGSFFEAIEYLMATEPLMWIVIGVLFGIIVGALPGIGTSLGMALLLPLTVVLDGVSAIIFLVSIYSGGMYGGSIAAILMNAPGTSSAAASTLDGYPMSRQGKAMDALASSAVASAFGGFITIAILILISPFIVILVLAFGSPEYFLVALLGISMIAIIVKGSPLKGIISGMFGLLVATVGLAPMIPQARYTFGEPFLNDGVSFVAAIIGLFAIAEMMKLAAEEGSISKGQVEMGGSIRNGVMSVVSKPWNLFKSALIGMGIGAVPGAGATVSTFVAYGEALRSSPNSDTFGKGNPDGLIAAEAANNSTISGSLVPTLAFGIPGSASTAVLLGGLIMHGLRPGPSLFTSGLNVTYAILIGLFLGNFLILFLGLTLISRMSFITSVDTDIIIPVIIVLGVTGGFLLRLNWFDVMTVFFLGIIGYYMKIYEYSIIAFVLGVVLGPIAEENLARSLSLSDGSLIIFISSPISIILTASIVLLLFGPFLAEPIKSRIS